MISTTVAAAATDLS